MPFAQENKGCIPLRLELWPQHSKNEWQNSNSNPNQNYLDAKKVHRAKFKVRTLNRIGQLPELTVSVIEHNIDTVCIQEHKLDHGKIEIKYHDTSNGRTFVLAYAWKNSVNAIIGEVGMHLNSYVLKSLKSIEKI